jgi:hypothetical protein
MACAASGECFVISPISSSRYTAAPAAGTQRNLSTRSG